MHAFQFAQLQSKDGQAQKFKATNLFSRLPVTGLGKGRDCYWLLIIVKRVISRIMSHGNFSSLHMPQPI
jgi:hypothetical protein